MPIVIVTKADEAQTLFETGEPLAPWGAIPPQSGTPSKSHIPGLRSWSLPGPVNSADLAPSAGSVDSAIVVAPQQFQPNPNSTFRRTARLHPGAAEVTVNPNVRGGVPCVGRGRWPIAHILDMIAQGVSPRHIIEDNPELSAADVQLAIRAASWVMRDPAIDWQALDLPAMLALQDEMREWQSLSQDGWEKIGPPQGV